MVTTGEETTGEETTGEETTGEGTTEATGGSSSGRPDCALIDNIFDCNMTLGCIWVGTPMAGDCQAL